MQSAGRAGRDAAYLAAQQTPRCGSRPSHPQHPLFAALRRHDYAAFAQGELAERAPPPACRPSPSRPCCAPTPAAQEAAQAFLNAASEAAEALPGADRVTRYPAVPPDDPARGERGAGADADRERPHGPPCRSCWPGGSRCCTGCARQPEGKASSAGWWTWIRRYLRPCGTGPRNCAAVFALSSIRELSRDRPRNRAAVLLCPQLARSLSPD